MRMNTLTMSREAVSPSPRRTEAKTDRKRSKGPEIRRTGNPPQITLKQIRCQFVYGIENQPRMTRITPKGRVKEFLMRPFGVIRVIRGWFSFPARLKTVRARGT